MFLLTVMGLAGASALSCASQSAATAAPAAEQQPAPATGPAVQGPAPEAPGATPQVAWADMTKQQRGKYMASVVMPRMKELFRSYDEKKFAEFNCKTCHGQDAKERGFEMPNPGLPVLPATQEGWAALAKDEPEFMAFMSQKVKPQMAALLDVKEYDHQNPQPGTFGCNNCHTVKSP